MSDRFVALLRGINVGGQNPVPMADLRATFEDLGAGRVVTYIQSGNVVFDGGRTGEAGWVERLERALSERFDYPASVILRSHAEMRAIVASAPAGFGGEPDRFRSDVVFLKAPATPDEVVASLRPRPGVDSMTAGDGVVYFERLTARASQSALSKIIGLPVYRRLTIRNWRTTTRLLAMLDELAG